jgi:hypothetical protein
LPVPSPVWALQALGLALEPALEALPRPVLAQAVAALLQPVLAPELALAATAPLRPAQAAVARWISTRQAVVARAVRAVALQRSVPAAAVLVSGLREPALQLLVVAVALRLPAVAVAWRLSLAQQRAGTYWVRALQPARALATAWRQLSAH